MKISFLALACTLALGAGGAFAADNDTSAQKPGSPSVVDKTKNTVRNAGEKLGRKLHLDKGRQQAGDDSSRGQPHAMGASRGQHMQDMHARKTEDEGSTSRRQRMDEAYARWQSQQHANQ